MADQTQRDQVYKFIETVRAIQAGREQGITLSQYWPRDIADAIQFLIDGAVRSEREACAIVAESAAEPGGMLARGEVIEADPVRRRICLEIAGSIRARR